MSEALDYNPFLRWSSAADCYNGLAREGFDLSVRDDSGLIYFTNQRHPTEHEVAMIRQEIDAYRQGLIAIIALRDAAPPVTAVKTEPQTTNCVLLTTPYDPDYVQDLKTTIPPAYRAWNKPEGRWEVWQPWCDRAIDVVLSHFPDDMGADWEYVDRPALRGVTVPESFNVIALPAAIPNEVRAEVWEKTNGLCWYCGVRLVPHRTFHVDHVHPRSDGGSDDLGNLVPACVTCNTDKGALLLETFRIKRGGGLFWFEIVRTL